MTSLDLSPQIHTSMRGSLTRALHQSMRRLYTKKSKAQVRYHFNRKAGFYCRKYLTDQMGQLIKSTKCVILLLCNNIQHCMQIDILARAGTYACTHIHTHCTPNPMFVMYSVQPAHLWAMPPPSLLNNTSSCSASCPVRSKQLHVSPTMKEAIQTILILLNVI